MKLSAKLFLIIAAVLTGLFVSTKTCTAAESLLTLSSNGQSDYVIILSAQAGASEKFAASELADHFRKMTGAQLPIRAEGGSRPVKAIYIGDGDAVRSLGVKIDSAALGSDGFVIRTVADDLVIAGGRRRGTLYGVYELLERCGVRWWTPMESFIPEKPTLTIPRLDETQIPTLEYRDMMYREIFGAEGHLWAARNKINGFAWESVPEHLGGRYKFVGNLVHSYNGLLSEGAAVMGIEITPEMRALYKDRRQSTQPCLSHPKVLEAITQAVIKKYRENPDARFVVVGQNDNHGYCRCENCQAIMDKYHAPSGIVLWFANRVLAEVRKELPDANICTAAYAWSRKPPVGIKPDDGVYITLCSIECDFAHSLAEGVTEVNKSFRDDIVQWGRIAKKIYIWDYTPNFHCFLMPHPNFDVLADNIRFFANNSTAGVFEQGSHTSEAAEFSALRMWVLARCLWDQSENGPDLINEFIEGYYGPAGDDIKKYVNLIHEPVRKDKNYVMRTVMEPSAIYCSSEIIAQGNKILARAESRLADKPAYLRRVRQVRMVPWAMIIKAGPDSSTFAAAAEAVGGDLDYSAMAASLIDTIGDWSLSRYSEHYKIQQWLKWLADYSRLCTGSTCPMPAEASADARIIQAGQLDSKLDKLVPAEGASDGWAMICDTDAWLFRKYLTTFDDITPGENYKLYIRVKCQPKVVAEGEPVPQDAFMVGVRSSGGHKTLKVKMDQVESDKWQVFEVANWQARKDDYIFYALTGKGGLKNILVDCIWLAR